MSPKDISGVFSEVKVGEEFVSIADKYPDDPQAELYPFTVHASPYPPNSTLEERIAKRIDRVIKGYSYDPHNI